LKTENKTHMKITVSTSISSTLEKVWHAWNAPEHIVNWYFASPEWHAPEAENDLRKDGKFKTKMAVKDGSFSFDFEGVYLEVRKHEFIEYILANNRRVQITFEDDGNKVLITETFDAENENTPELQLGGWQAILDSFKSYVERLD